MVPLDNRYWAPTPVRLNNPHPLQFLPIEFPQPQVAQQDIDLDSYEDSEEYLGYPLYNYHIDSYVWLDLLPFDTFELQIPESENIFGNLFGDLILDMEDFILELPISEDENIFGNLFGDYFLSDDWDINWDNELENNSLGFYGFLFGYGFITSQEEYDEVFGSFLLNSNITNNI